MTFSLIVSSGLTLVLALVLASKLGAQLGNQHKYHLDGAEHHFHTLHGIWSETELQALRKMVEDYKVVPSSTKDQTSSVEEVAGEAQERVNGECRHPFLVPSTRNSSLCILPSRFDVGRHYVMTGGRKGFKEKYARVLSRILGFNKFILAQEDQQAFMQIPELKALFESQGYLSGAAAVCNLDTDTPILDPFQLGIIMNIPGQQTSTHLDVPYFYGATRFDTPSWLLVVMQMSGLWEDKRVAQVQGVAYLHDWEDEEENLKQKGGAFFYHKNGVNEAADVFLARTNAAIICDGSLVVHGSEPFLPYEKDIQFMKKEDENELVFAGNDTWALHVNGEPVASYGPDRRRMALVWRSRCFRDEAEKAAYDATPPMSVESIVDTLVADLRARNRLSGKTPQGLDLANLLMDEYVTYPRPDAKIPVNFCVIDRLFPNMPIGWLLNLFCD